MRQEPGEAVSLAALASPASKATEAVGVQERDGIRPATLGEIRAAARRDLYQATRSFGQAVHPCAPEPKHEGPCDEWSHRVAFQGVVRRAAQHYVSPTIAGLHMRARAVPA